MAGRRCTVSGSRAASGSRPHHLIAPPTVPRGPATGSAGTAGGSAWSSASAGSGQPVRGSPDRQPTGRRRSDGPRRPGGPGPGLAAPETDGNGPALALTGGVTYGLLSRERREFVREWARPLHEALAVTLGISWSRPVPSRCLQEALYPARGCDPGCVQGGPRVPGRKGAGLASRLATHPQAPCHLQRLDLLLDQFCRPYPQRSARLRPCTSYTTGYSHHPSALGDCAKTHPAEPKSVTAPDGAEHLAVPVGCGPLARRLPPLRSAGVGPVCSQPYRCGFAGSCHHRISPPATTTRISHAATAHRHHLRRPVTATGSTCTTASTGIGPYTCGNFSALGSGASYFTGTSSRPGATTSTTSSSGPS